MPILTLPKNEIISLSLHYNTSIKNPKPFLSGNRYAEGSQILHHQIQDRNGEEAEDVQHRYQQFVHTAGDFNTFPYKRIYKRTVIL